MDGAAPGTHGALGVVKVRLVGIHAMELDHAPPALRLAFEGYVGIPAVALGALSLAA